MTTTLTFATWNVNSINVRRVQAAAWLEGHPEVDVLFLQETKTTADAFPSADFDSLGFDSYVVGQKTYNGCAVLVRRGRFKSVSDAVRGLPGYNDDQARFVSVLLELDSGEKVRACSAYVPNGREAGSVKYIYKLDWLSHMHLMLVEEAKKTPFIVVGGDFNIAPEDVDLWDASEWRMNILSTNPERGALERILSAGFFDSYRAANPTGRDYSWWDYKAGAFKRDKGVRIDLVLASSAMRSRLAAAGVDKTPRGLEQPSDHAPAFASFVFED